MTTDTTEVPTLDVVKEKYGACKLCTEVCGGPVLYRGKPSPICFVAEALGEHDLRLGEPLIGPSGQVFRKLLIASGIDIEDVFLMNTASCRPNNNEITDTIIKNCRPIREALLEACAPRVIVAVGGTAIKALVPDNKRGIMSIMGNVFRYGRKQIPVVATLHPSYIMRREGFAKTDPEKMIITALKATVVGHFQLAKRISEGGR